MTDRSVIVNREPTDCRIVATWKHFAGTTHRVVRLVLIQFSSSQDVMGFDTVIASEAKQSITAKEEWIASSLALLAMTWKYDFAISRRDAPESCVNIRPENQRAWGMPGARCTRSLACSKKHAS